MAQSTAKKQIGKRPEVRGGTVLVGIHAPAENVERWKARAAAEHRSLSNWLLLRLFSVDARDEELSARASEMRDGA